MWIAVCQLAFGELRNLQTSAPVLAYPDFGVLFILETHGSGSKLGVVLAQQQKDGLGKPITYASRGLQEHNKQYGVTELEGLKVVWAMKHFRPYLCAGPKECLHNWSGQTFDHEDYVIKCMGGRQLHEY